MIANLILVPRFGMMGAAWAATASYALLAVVATAFSRRVYPVPYEWGRLGRIAVAGATAWLVAGSIVPLPAGTIAGLLLRGVVTTLTYGAVLWFTGFIGAHERREIERLAARIARPLT